METRFEFEVRDAFHLGSDFKGDATLIGPVLVDGKLQVGDLLMVVSTEDDNRAVQCVEFPLVNLAPDRVDWVRVSVRGIAPAEVRVGKVARRVVD